jgi:hypothetical protein
MPTSPQVPAQGFEQFSALVSGTADTRVVWSLREGAAAGIIRDDGLYQAQSPGVFHVVATSAAVPSASAETTVTVTAATSAVTIALSRYTATVAPSESLTLQATVSGSSDTSVTWSVNEGAAGGTVDASGVYRAPATPGTVHVTATAHADPLAKATATISVVVPVDVVDHGGPLEASPRVYALWWGDKKVFPADVVATQEAMIRGLSGSANLGVLDQYLRGAHASVQFVQHLDDATASPSTDAELAAHPPGAEACAALAAAHVMPAPDDVVLIYGSNGYPTWRSCAYHTFADCGSPPVRIRVAFAPNPDGTRCAAIGAAALCNARSGTANALASWMAHELAEIVTDPEMNAWYDAGLEEISDKCEGEMRCVSLGGTPLWLQAQYSNAGHACLPQ